MKETIERIRKIDVSDFPDFYSCKTPLEMGLWVLRIAKEKLLIKTLTAEQIALIIRDAKEMTVSSRSINNAFTRAGNKIHIHNISGQIYFEIMKPGKIYLDSQLKRPEQPALNKEVEPPVKKGSIALFYFEPDKRFTSKKLLIKNILDNLGGEMRIVDPYCGERTLDILHNVKNSSVKFLTRIENLNEKDRGRFLRELKDFKTENPNVEFKSCPNKDIHDRYIISPEHLVILGHSIKDLGAKESFSIMLNIHTNKNIVEDLIENFNRRWQQATTL